MKKENGITLIALVIMIIVLILIASVSLTTGVGTLHDLRLKGFYSQLEVVQKRVDDIASTNETYIDENGNEINIIEAGSELTEGQMNVLSETINREGGGLAFDISNFRYFTKEDIKNILDIPDIDYNLFIDFDNRIIIAEEGIQIKDETYQMLESTTYFIDANENKNIGNVDFDVKASKLGKSKYKIIIEPSKNVGDLQGTGTIQYKDVFTKYWEKSNKLEIIVEEKLPKYFDIKYQDINNNITNPPKSYGIYLDDKGDVKVTEVAKIYTAVELLAIPTDSINTKDEEKVKTYLLMNDITFTPADKNIAYWKPIGDVIAEEGLQELPKEGRFDGNNKEIHVNYSDDGDYTIVYNKSNNYREKVYDFNIKTYVVHEGTRTETNQATVYDVTSRKEELSNKKISVKRGAPNAAKVQAEIVGNISFEPSNIAIVVAKNPEKINTNVELEISFKIVTVKVVVKNHKGQDITNNAKVTINEEECTLAELTNGISMIAGIEILYNSNCKTYLDKNGKYTPNASDVQILTITMDPVLYSFTINPTPSDASVTIKDTSGTTLISGTGSKTVSVQEGIAVIWIVSKEGKCETDTNSSSPLVINSNTTKDITLKATFTINSNPNTATVEIKNSSGTVLASGVGTATVTQLVGTKLKWTVSKPTYITNNPTTTITLNENTTKTITLDPVMYSFTLNPTPSDASVTIENTSGTTLASGTGSKTVSVQEGTSIIWTVSRLNCDTVTNSSSPLVINSNTTKDIRLNATLTINSKTTGAMIEIRNTSGTLLSSGTGTAKVSQPAGTKVKWKVSKIGYITQEGEATLGDSPLTVTLAVKTVTFEIIPRVDGVVVTDAVVTMNGTERTSMQVQEGTTVSYTVSKTGYVTQSGQIAARETPLYIDLEPRMINFAIKLSENYENYKITINGKSVASEQSIRVQENSVVEYKVSADWRKTKSATYTMGTSDYVLNVSLDANIVNYLVTAANSTASEGTKNVSSGRNDIKYGQIWVLYTCSEFQTKSSGVNAWYTWQFNASDFNGIDTILKDVNNRQLLNISLLYCIDTTDRSTVARRPDVRATLNIGGTVMGENYFERLNYLGPGVIDFRECDAKGIVYYVENKTHWMNNISLDLLKSNTTTLTINYTSHYNGTFSSANEIKYYGASFTFECLDRYYVETTEASE